MFACQCIKIHIGYRAGEFQQVSLKANQVSASFAENIWVSPLF
jgi:hypothetical protein